MENISKAYAEVCESMKRFVDVVESAKLKLVYDGDDEGKPTPIDEIIRGALEKTPIFHPSIDDIVNDAMELSVMLSKYPSKDFDTPHVTQNDVYKMILDYFPNNPTLIDHVSGVVNHAGKYHTNHWKYTFDAIMDCNIFDVIKVKLVDYINESGDIKINGHGLEKSDVYDSNAIGRMIEIMKHDEEELP